MKLSQVVAITGCGLLLAGCAPKLVPNDNGNGTGNMISVSGLKAANAKGQKSYTKVLSAKEASKHVETRYVPVAVPGQLMPVPTKKQLTNVKKFASPIKAIDHANKQAVVQPTQSDFFNSMATYNYMPNALYVVYTAPMQITDIQLQPGEKIVSESAGDTLRWQIAQTYSGQGASMRQHLLIKPNKAGLTNTVLITTNRRVYHLILKSTNNNSFMVGVKWHYPGKMVRTFQPEAEAITSAANAGTGGTALTNLDFNYSWYVSKGKRPEWMPQHIYSNQRQTIIEFPKNFSNDEQTPILSVAEGSHARYGTALANWRMEDGRYMVVDSVLQDARLIVGNKKQGETIVQIQHVTSNN